MRSLTFLLFVAITFCCWGTYGPVLHVGQAEMGAAGKLSSLRPFICVGLAYFLIAVIFPLIVLMTKGEKGSWSIGGFVWSFIAGAVGAIGALGIIMAFKFEGKPVYVMPLVFGCAPIVNTFVTMAMARTFKNASFVFYLGIILVAVGAAGVLRFKPVAPKHVDPAPAVSVAAPGATNVVFQAQETGALEKTVEPENDNPSESAARESSSASEDSPANASSLTDEPEASAATKAAARAGNIMFVVLSIFVTAVCWGAYGPVLHKGQTKMNGSRLRPFLCVGLAYFAIAVLVPYFLLPQFPEPGGWDHTAGVLWSLLAGAVGAVGALGIIYAFNFGGKPIFVMPLVFGFAPVINTFTEMSTKGLAGQISPYFYASLLMVIVGAMIVLIFAPKSAPHK
jgi:hypothetical protein